MITTACQGLRSPLLSGTGLSCDFSFHALGVRTRVYLYLQLRTLVSQSTERGGDERQQQPELRQTKNAAKRRMRHARQSVFRGEPCNLAVVLHEQRVSRYDYAVGIGSRSCAERVINISCAVPSNGTMFTPSMRDAD